MNRPVDDANDFDARQRAEAQLDRFFSLSLDFLCISSADGYFKRVSPAVTEMLGWSTEEFLSKPFLDFVHPDDHDATMREVERQVVAGERVLRFENRYRHKDGSWRILSWRSMPQPDGLMYATARDVTEQRANDALLREAKDELETRVATRTAELARANESLKRNERRFRALVEHGSDSFALVDAAGKIRYLSPAVRSVEGYEPDELIGRPTLEHTHPDDIPRVREAMQKLIANPGRPVPVLWRRRHKNGMWIWLEGVSTNMLDDPAVSAIVTNYRNVTGRILAEKRLEAQLARLGLLSQITRAIGEHQDLRSIFQIVVRSIEEQLPLDFACLCLYSVSDNSLTVTSVGARNPSLTTRLALTEQARVEIDENGLSRCVRGSLVHEPDLTMVPFPFPRRLVGAGLKTMVAAPLLSESRVFGVLIAARCEASSFSSGECEFLRQLSEHVALAAHQAQLYGSLQEAYEELRRTQQAVMQQERLRVLGQMASGIAHDINNAISPIALYTESLLEREPSLTDQGRRYLQTIRRAIEDVAETVTRMREFYRQRDAHAPLAPVQLNALVPQVVELTRARWADMPHLRGAAIETRTELAAGLPLIRGTESELREALTNLIFNAVDAMPNGGTLTISTRALAPASDKVLLEVADTGIGMDEETRRRCLELFFTTKGERGTGLGLAMVYGIVERHDAEIEIDSIPGKGTRVRLVFAVRHEVHAAALVAPHEPPSALHILVVDDDPVLLKSMRDTLESDGYTIITANGGQEGIDAFLSSLEGPQAFDLVITDLGMPSVDGRKVATAIKAASPSTPIIMLTGWGQRMVNDGELPANVDRVLSKPPRLRDLRDAMAEVPPHCA